jgi:hypothetical protein
MKTCNQGKKGKKPMAKTQVLDGTDLAPVKPRAQSATRQRGVVPSAELVPMQFKMPREFVRAFKVAAASNDMKFNELLKACFDAFMKSR